MRSSVRFPLCVLSIFAMLAACRATVSEDCGQGAPPPDAHHYMNDLSACFLLAYELNERAPLPETPIENEAARDVHNAICKRLCPHSVSGCDFPKEFLTNSIPIRVLDGSANGADSASLDDDDRIGGSVDGGADIVACPRWSGIEVKCGVTSECAAR